MPSSPKKTAKTGSLLLGQELRRLRGGRSLREICELTRTPPLSEHVSSLSEAGLCEIESGKSMPTLQTLQTLAMIYRTSVTELLSYTTMERVLSTAGTQPPARNDEDVESHFQALLADCRWHEALAVAIRGEARAEHERQLVAWRSNRAACLSQIGMHAEALNLLTACCESPVLSASQRIAMLHNLCASHLNAGNIRAASRIARETLELAESECSAPDVVAALQRLRGNLLVSAHRAGLESDERQVRLALRLLESARTAWPVDDQAGLADLQLLIAEAWSCLGNDLVAARDAEQVAAAAKRLGSSFLASRASLLLAWIDEKKARFTEAISRLDDALHHAQACHDPELELEARFRLFMLQRDARPGMATKHLRQCEALLPLITAETSWVKRYDEYVRSAR